MNQRHLSDEKQHQHYYHQYQYQYQQQEQVQEQQEQNTQSSILQKLKKKPQECKICY
ncbi:uncharacterized protein SETTUDRAFT_167857 [Exserohilum turcica Et28A]|uniref:Uncharacterized protein n=1 Tax=Exserohilum turcicum (strain 28A) TaxID=671987 RepID=R0K8Q4_EXST2|nr:uncharacterized protein SETTUDRAFT_167857 [Exserohilum turcica Et28A]EOA89353.1 hypothetical protein SETTUDRAFT_167857 [Exserohilum turcica Et28A]